MNLKKIGLFAIAMIMTLFSFQTYSFAAEEMEWVKKAPMPNGKESLRSLVYEDRIYVYGGYGNDMATSALEMYDPEIDQWKQLASSSIPRFKTGLVQSQGKFYAIGGYNYTFPDKVTNKVEEYDPNSNTWVAKQDMPTPRYDVYPITLGEQIYTFGGASKDGRSDAVEVFNPQTDTWITKNPMPVKADRAIPFLINNSIYVLAVNHNTEVPTFLYNYNPIEDTWTFIKQAPELYGTVYVHVNDEKVFYFGSSLSYYDSLSKKLVQYPVKPLGRSNFTSEFVNDHLYAIGGYKDLNDVFELAISDTSKPDPDPDPNLNPDPNPEPNPNPTGNALLVIYMDSGLIKEYEMTNEEIRNFTEWYEGRAKGNGREAYIVNKKYNIGPFNSRKDFISYSHIESFEVQEYSR
ncbi:galactose oxidase [Brevibacillus laterosporus]|nr:kelch repeat-containing protein [Brevibacillus laterosporus]RJL15327.1 galactose oxidase [Brevibacillus laterosporus]TPH06508.1 galactose oxidase [Brevibacillus laterosporus]